MYPSKEISSFRDQSGFVFYGENQVFRAIHTSYQAQYQALLTSGLYDSLVEKRFLIEHQELKQEHWPALPDLPAAGDRQVVALLEVPRLPFISYPYEWCFQQLKDAALLTLDIQLLALQHGMTLKDASAFNVQFRGTHPLFIDTLSFDFYEAGKPWVAYRQFCTHFLAPLALMAHAGPELHRLNQLYIDGIPLTLASKLLPWKTKFSPFLLAHIHYHARLESRYAADSQASQKVRGQLSKSRLIAIVQHLKSGIESLMMPVSKSEWGDYYQEFSYSDEAIAHKKSLVKEWATLAKPRLTWDLGCNVGLFSRLVGDVSGQVTAFDIDHLAIEKFYLSLKQNPAGNILPLVLDLSNPTPAIGWANRERQAFAERGPADLVMALALIHHLALGNNVPFDQIAQLLSSVGRALIIEFVPKNDPQSRRLLVTKADVFDEYNQAGFERIFGQYFTIEKRETIRGTDRLLYFMQKQ